MDNNILNKRTKGEWQVSSTIHNEVVAYPNAGKERMLNMPLKIATANLSYSIVGIVGDKEEANANAAFICKAVNNYDSLLEALKMCINYVGGIANESEPAMNAYLNAKAAIEKASN